MAPQSPCYLTIGNKQDATNEIAFQQFPSTALNMLVHVENALKAVRQRKCGVV